MAGKSRNWHILSNKAYSDTEKGRDVYNEQQLERGRLQKKQSMFSRQVIALLISIAVGMFVYSAWCVCDVVIHETLKLDISSNTQGESVSDNDGDQSVSDDNGDNQKKSESKWRIRSGKHIVVSILSAIITFFIIQPIMRRNLDAQNMLADTSDINQYSNDQHIALPEEIQRKFNYFPDVGAHSSVQVSSLISHMALKNKGIDKIKVPKRYKNNVVDRDGSIINYAGDIICDEDENPIYDMMPMFDTRFADALFEASGAPKEVRLSYDVRNIEYNPENKNREKLCETEDSKKLFDKFVANAFKKDIKQLPKFETVADLINKDWELPDYEPQRPGGAYIVDSAPVNTMVLAITRAGKGQTVIEPTIDMWMREKRPNNMVINDPKGELLVKNYVRGTVRGFQIVQFNLINAMKTDIYNPLGMAAQAAREGDFTRCAAYVENIAEVFFPLDGGEDPLWPNAANNAFKRAAYGLIDYYLESERKYRNECNRRIAAGELIDPQVMETEIDVMWGRVTLYNCYQMFTQLSGKKITNPLVEFSQKMKSGEYEGKNQAVVAEIARNAKLQGELWGGAEEMDCLSLYFNATDKLPRNSMRTLIGDVNNSLKSMSGAEKMLASVYGIAITAMSFFTDPTISTLTSGTPSQTFDLGGLSFPRRLGVRFHPDFIKQNHYVGLRCKWDAFADKEFTKPLGKLFDHSDVISREGWARYFFDGKFESDTAYLRLRLLNSNTDVLVHTYYFEFHKGYQTSLDGRTYTKDPILGTKIAKNGVIYELVPKNDKYEAGTTTFSRKQLVHANTLNEKEIKYISQDEMMPVITQSYVRYSEKPKMIFLVTPPHLMKYAKLILILIKQLVDLNFDQSYITKSNQKPLYKTRYMLDELGNLQSEGHGISGLSTMLSIGLGQDQQFTLILQTLQQLRDVYGESVDKIVQGNTSNIIFLKSTDDTMLETLEKMSGKTHKSFIDQKTVTRDMEKLFLANEGKASYVMQTKEVPVISYNDMAFIADRNSIVFRAGDSPIWNRNETILPMSFKLFENTINIPGKDFSLQTIPTLSSTMDFDLKTNQPDFDELLMSRIQQAIIADKVMDSYKKAFGYSDDEIRRLDIDIYANDIMDMIDAEIAAKNHKPAKQDSNTNNGQKKNINRGVTGSKVDNNVYMNDEYENALNELHYLNSLKIKENTEMRRELERVNITQAHKDKRIYAGGQIAKSDLMNYSGQILHSLDSLIISVYTEIKEAMDKDSSFTNINGSLCDRANGTVYIQCLSSAPVKELAEASKDKHSNVYADSEITSEDAKLFASYRVTDEFYRLLVSMNSWNTIANGQFEEQMAKKYNSL